MGVFKLLAVFLYDTKLVYYHTNGETSETYESKELAMQSLERHIRESIDEVKIIKFVNNTYGAVYDMDAEITIEKDKISVALADIKTIITLTLDR
jgi:hypothetical protein